MKPGNASTYRKVWCFVKYRHIRVFSVRLKRSTILAFVSSLCVTKWWIPCVSKSFWKGRLRNSVPCPSVMLSASCSPSANARTPRRVSRRLYSLTERTMPVSKKTSITVNRNFVPSLYFFRFATSTRSACHCWF